MTEEKGALSHQRVLKIALPIVLANATVPILGAVDTGVVGQLGEAAPIGAVGIGAIILSAIYWLFGFLRMGTVGLTSQAHGAGDTAEVAALLIRALLIGAAAGVVLVILQVPILHTAFAVAPASDQVETLARSYIEIRIWSAPAAIATYGITGWLIALERTRSVLIMQVVMNGLNIVLDVVFVLGFELGVEGVAAATVIAELSGAALGLWLCRDMLRGVLRPGMAERVFDRNRLARMGMVSGDIMIRSILLEAAFVSFLFLGAGFGDTVLAANQVLLQFLHITAYALDGFAFAAETLVGQAMGARNRVGLRRAAVLASGWGVVISLVMTVGFAVLGGRIIDLMTTADAVRAAARDYLGWMVLAPVAGAGAWMLDGIFIGATRTADMRNMMIVSFAIYCAAVAALMPGMANHGLWAALLLMFLARGVTLGLRYRALENGAAAH